MTLVLFRLLDLHVDSSIADEKGDEGKEAGDDNLLPSV